MHPKLRVVAEEKRGYPRYWPLAAVAEEAGFPRHWVVGQELVSPMRLVVVVGAYVHPTR